MTEPKRIGGDQYVVKFDGPKAEPPAVNTTWNRPPLDIRESIERTREQFHRSALNQEALRQIYGDDRNRAHMAPPPSTKVQALFIGGTCDGDIQYVDSEAREMYRQLRTAKATFNRELYHASRFEANTDGRKVEFRLFIVSGMTDAEAMQQLIDKYHATRGMNR